MCPVPICHFCTLYVCFPRSTQGFPLQLFLPVTFGLTTTFAVSAQWQLSFSDSYIILFTYIPTYWKHCLPKSSHHNLLQLICLFNSHFPTSLSDITNCVIVDCEISIAILAHWLTDIPNLCFLFISRRHLFRYSAVDAYRSICRSLWTRPLTVTCLMTCVSWTAIPWHHRPQTDVTCSPDMTSSLTVPCRSSTPCHNNA